jgi:hypothetical protein
VRQGAIRLLLVQQHLQEVHLHSSMVIMVAAEVVAVEMALDPTQAAQAHR